MTRHGGFAGQVQDHEISLHEAAVGLRARRELLLQVGLPGVGVPPQEVLGGDVVLERLEIRVADAVNEDRVAGLVRVMVTELIAAPTGLVLGLG